MQPEQKGGFDTNIISGYYDHVDDIELEFTFDK